MAAGALLKELGELIPSTVLADDLAKSFAMTEVLSG